MARTPPRTDGSSALKLDFGTARPSGRGSSRTWNAGTNLRTPEGPDLYKTLEHRRRQAQIAARRLLDLLEGD